MKEGKINAKNSTLHNLQIERKIRVNVWIFKLRWFYIAGLFLVGVLANIVSKRVYHFPWPLMVSLVVFAVAINIAIYIGILNVKKSKNKIGLSVLNHCQIIVELVMFTLVLYLAGSLESMSFIFYVLPIISSSILFGPSGAIITALLSSGLISSLVFFEYFEIIPHISRYEGITTTWYTAFSVTLTNLVDISFFFIILGIFSGFISKLLTEREKKLEDKTINLLQINKSRERELKQLDKATKLLIDRDKELTKINKDYNEKIKELEKSQLSMFKAFTDLKKERKNAEDEKNKTVSIISNFIDPIIVLDKLDKVSLFNPAARSIFLMDEYDLGKKVSSKNNYSMENFQKIIQNKYKVEKSKFYTAKDEEEMIVDYRNQKQIYKVTTAKVTDNKGQFFGTMKVFYNLTREKMVDKLKSDFISIAAHQLRTPLSAIKWVIKMILDGDVGKLNKEQQKLLYKGYSSNERIIKLVNDMLNVSRIEEGRFGYIFKKCDLLEILNNNLENFKNKIKDKKIKINIKKPSKIPTIYIDEEKITLVVENLIDNAIKYTPINGTIDITIKKLKHYFEFTIKDNGVGIPEKDQDKMFTKFFRANNVVRLQTEGSGLGLFIVKNIIEKHKGEISVESQEGKGTAVSFTLPIKSDKLTIKKKKKL